MSNKQLCYGCGMEFSIYADDVVVNDPEAVFRRFGRVTGFGIVVTDEFPLCYRCAERVSDFIEGMHFGRQADEKRWW